MESTEQANVEAAPAAPAFLVKATDRAKVTASRTLTLGRTVGEAIEAGVNEFTLAIFEEGFGYAHNSFSTHFMAQAQDAALMRQALAAIMVKIETDGSFTDADAIRQTLQSLSPLPS